MALFEAVDRFYYNLTLSELRSMNENTIYPSITYNSFLYLDLIAYKDRCTVSYLADALHISKSAVTVKVNELIRLGLVTKTQSEKDRRVYYLTVSSEVAADNRQYDKRLRGAVRTLERRYGEKDLEKFREMLDVLSASYLEEPE